MAHPRAEIFECPFLACCYMHSAVLHAGKLEKYSSAHSKNHHNVLFIKQLHEPELRALIAILQVYNFASINLILPEINEGSKNMPFIPLCVTIYNSYFNVLCLI